MGSAARGRTSPPNIRMTCAKCSIFCPFSTACNIFQYLFEKMLPALGGEHIFVNQPDAFRLKNTTFQTPKG